MKLLKGTTLVIFLLVLIWVSCNLWLEKESTLALLSKDGYKDLHKGESIILTKQNKRLRFGVWSIPGSLEEKLSLQITFPRLLKRGIIRFQITAEDNDLIFSNIETTVLEEKLTQEKKYRFPPDWSIG